MMDDLISRQAAIKALDNIGSLDTDADREYARQVFEALPAAELRKGKWMKEQYSANGYTHIDGYRCSKCTLMYPWPTNYCPNCGARMEGESDGK